MSEVLTSSLTDLCKRLEAFQTPRWAIEAVLDVELTTNMIFDPCAGLGAIGEVCRDRGFDIDEMDIVDWADELPQLCRTKPITFFHGDFLTDFEDDLSDTTIVMNPPFSLAEEFVSRAQVLNARKIITFQRQAWRESAGRRLWWEGNSPARVWVCGARADCWRFDLLGSEKARTSGTNTAYAWYVWERGHKGAELTSAIYPAEKRK